MAEDEIPFRYVPPVDPNIGRRVDGHIVQSLIARGGMGAAYLARHVALSRSLCVIKLVLAEIARHPQAIARFKLEAEALSLFKHDNIVKLQNFGVLDDGQLYLRFEYIEGKSLDKYVAGHGGRLPLRKAANFIFQVCGAFDYAHRLHVIHRDLKPDNLMVESNASGFHLKERIKILDFGIAKVASDAGDLTGSGATVGTARFMAPEQATNAAAVSGKADVFSLAQIFYVVVAGTMPWGIPDNDVAIYHRQLTQPPAVPPEHLMPAAVAKVILRALSINPDDRPTMREFAVELACAIQAEGGCESGLEILEKVIPDWVPDSSATSAPDAETLPHPAVADPTVTSAPPQLTSDAPDARATVGDNAPSASFSSVGNPIPSAPLPGDASAAVDEPSAPRPEVVRSLADLTVTANQRPRASAAPRVAAVRAAVGSAGADPSTSIDAPEPRVLHVGRAAVEQASRHPPTPMLAALPTGLASQRFSAQVPSIEARETPFVVASEFELATGTPGPPEYAHVELPAVLVSTTELSGVTPSRDAVGTQLPSAPEPPPLVFLPEAARRAFRRKLVVVVLGACMLALVVCLTIIRLAAPGSRAPSKQVPDVDTTSAVARPETRSGDDSLTLRAAALNEPDRDVHAERAPQADGERSAVSVDAASGDRVVTPKITTSDPTETPSKASQPTMPAPGPDAAKPAPTSTPRPAPEPATAKPETAAPKPARGRLTVHVDPFADVWIDGRFVKTTPIENLSLPAGTHRVRLRNEPGERDETMLVTIDPTKPVVIEKNW